MEEERAIDYLENSFLAPLISDKTVTDITYNGSDIYYESFRNGNRKYQEVISSDHAFNLIKQLLNYCGYNFSYSEPITSVTFGRYRLNALHPSICKKSGQKAVNFAIRLFDDDIRYVPDNSDLEKLLTALVNSDLSMVVFGTSGSGKTELQKYLISLHQESKRIIIIDNINEIGIATYPDNLDISYWICGDNNKKVNASDLTEAALRANADKIILAEARGGKEMINVLNAALTGHATIVTLHANDASLVHRRIARLCSESSASSSFNNVLDDVNSVFTILIEMNQETSSDGSVMRFVKSITCVNSQGKSKVFYYKKDYIAVPEISYPCPSVVRRLGYRDGEDFMKKVLNRKRSVNYEEEC